MKYFAIIDTNVLISAMLKHQSVPGNILDMVFSGIITPVLNYDIESEYRDVLSRSKFHLPKDLIDEIMNWLKEHIHTYGFRYEAPELMKMVTGEEFNVNYFLDYIEEKYTKLYQL